MGRVRRLVGDDVRTVEADLAARSGALRTRVDTLDREVQALTPTPETPQPVTGWQAPVGWGLGQSVTVARVGEFRHPLITGRYFDASKFPKALWLRNAGGSGTVAKAVCSLLRSLYTFYPHGLTGRSFRITQVPRLLLGWPGRAVTIEDLGWDPQRSVFPSGPVWEGPNDTQAGWWHVTAPDSERYVLANVHCLESETGWQEDASAHDAGLVYRAASWIFEGEPGWTDGPVWTWRDPNADVDRFVFTSPNPWSARRPPTTQAVRELASWFRQRFGDAEYAKRNGRNVLRAPAPVRGPYDLVAGGPLSFTYTGWGSGFRNASHVRLGMVAQERYPECVSEPWGLPGPQSSIRPNPPSGNAYNGADITVAADDTEFGPFLLLRSPALGDHVGRGDSAFDVATLVGQRLLLESGGAS